MTWAILAAVLLDVAFMAAGYFVGRRKVSHLESENSSLRDENLRLIGIMERSGIQVRDEILGGGRNPDHSVASWTGEKSDFAPDVPKGSAARWDEGRQ